LHSVTVLCARSWGKLGNLNAAKVVANRLQQSEKHWAVKVETLEDHWPEFESWGQEMQRASSLPSAELVNGAYQSIYSRIHAAVMPDGQGLLSYTPHSRQAEIVSRLRASIIERTDIVIATKGIATRLLAAARATSPRKPVLVNWVTNPGLLGIRMHQRVEADIHCVPLPEHASVLTEGWGVPVNDVHVVGPPIGLAFAQNRDLARDNPRPVPKAVIAAYLHVLSVASLDAVATILRGMGDAEAHVLFASMDEDSEARLADYRNEFGARLSVERAVEHKRFLEKLILLRAAERKILIAKSGPNTVFEATGLGLPIICYRSGLPQEEWVLDFLEHQGVGRGVREIADIAPTALRLLRDPDELEAITSRQRLLWDRLSKLSATFDEVVKTIGRRAERLADAA
jgi:hypothetical protein